MIATEYDILMSIQIGMVSLLRRGLADTALPANYLDTDFSKDLMPQPRPKDEFTPVSFAQHYSELVRLMGEITVSLGSVSFPSMIEVEQHRERILALHDGLPPILRPKLPNMSLGDPTDLVIDRQRLEILHQKAFCMLYRPFLGREDFSKEHNWCISAAEELVRILIPMAEACQPGGRFATLTVFVERHVHDFNLAAMLLCSELKKRSTLDNDPWIPRIRSLLLQCSGLWLLKGVTSPKARHAITAIEKFLQSSQKIEGMFNDGQVFEPATNIPDPVPNTAGLPTDKEIFFNAMSSIDGTGLPTMDGPFNSVQDPLFQELFGPQYAFLEQQGPTWV
jgi:hypothetical protein